MASAPHLRTRHCRALGLGDCQVCIRMALHTGLTAEAYPLEGLHVLYFEAPSQESMSPSEEQRYHGRTLWMRLRKFARSIVGSEQSKCEPEDVEGATRKSASLQLRDASALKLISNLQPKPHTERNHFTHRAELPGG